MKGLNPDNLSYYPHPYRLHHQGQNVDIGYFKRTLPSIANYLKANGV